MGGACGVAPKRRAPNPLSWGFFKHAKRKTRSREKAGYLPDGAPSAIRTRGTWIRNPMHYIQLLDIIEEKSIEKVKCQHFLSLRLANGWHKCTFSFWLSQHHLQLFELVNNPTIANSSTFEQFRDNRVQFVYFNRLCQVAIHASVQEAFLVTRHGKRCEGHYRY